MVVTTEEVMQHHVQALRSRDIDGIMSDYAEDAVLITENGIIKGWDGIRDFFSKTISLFPTGTLEHLTINKQLVDGEFVFIIWSVDQIVPWASDTLCIRNGKIVMQSGVS